MENIKREMELKKIADGLDISEAAHILKFTMEKTGNTEFSSMHMGEKNKLFTLIAVNDDKDSNMHKKVIDLIDKEYWDFDWTKEDKNEQGKTT